MYVLDINPFKDPFYSNIHTHSSFVQNCDDNNKKEEIHLLFFDGQNSNKKGKTILG